VEEAEEREVGGGFTASHGQWFNDSTHNTPTHSIDVIPPHGTAHACGHTDPFLDASEQARDSSKVRNSRRRLCRHVVVVWWVTGVIRERARLRFDRQPKSLHSNHTHACGNYGPSSNNNTSTTNNITNNNRFTSACSSGTGGSASRRWRGWRRTWT
jgi:hypothetical protein